MKTELRICTECHVPHYENCERCFGFGLKKWPTGNLGPASAIESYYFVQSGKRDIPSKYQECSKCHSTLLGIPNEA